MQYRQLGNSGLQVSSFSVGTMNLKASASRSDYRVFDAAIAAGVNYIDTADRYMGGSAESFIGNLTYSKRSQVLIGTKCYFPKSSSPLESGLSRKNLIHSVETSLTRMSTDLIDILFLHRFDENTPVEETLSTVQNLIASGKVLYWGCSGCTPYQLCKLYFTAKHMAIQPPIAAQYAYNLFNRSLEMEIAEVLRETGIGVFGYYPLAQGVLTGKYSDVEAKTGRAKSVIKRNTMWDLRPERLEKAKQFKELAEQHGVSPAVLAVKWALRNPCLSSSLTSFSNSGQLSELLKGLDQELPEEIWIQVSRIFDNDPIHPYTGIPYINH